MQDSQNTSNAQTSSLAQLKANLIEELKQRVEDKIIEENNAELLEKLIKNAETKAEALSISALGTTYKRTGFHFDKRLEKQSEAIHYLAKDETLSFRDSNSALTHSLIIGDNYPALLNLLITYRQKIKVIYIDPPYGKDDLGEFAQTNYNNAISRDNLLSMLYPRLVLAKELLKDDGVIFCSIDDRNQAYVKCLFDEVFGERNFCGHIIWLKGNTQNDADTLQKNHEYTLCYARNIEIKPINKLKQKEKVRVFKDGQGKFFYEGYGLSSGSAEGGRLENRPNLGYTIYYNPLTKDFIGVLDYDKEYARDTTKHSELYKDNEELTAKGYITIRPPKMGAGLGRWTWALDKFNTNKNEILIKENKNGYSVLTKKFLNSKQVKQDEKGEYYAIIEKENPPKSFIDCSSGSGTTILKTIMGDKVFANPKPLNLIKHLLKISTSANSTNLDNEQLYGGGAECPHSVESKDSNRDVSATPQHDNLSCHSENSLICHSEALAEESQDSGDVSATSQHDNLSCHSENSLICHSERSEESQDSGDVLATSQHDNLSCHSERSEESQNRQRDNAESDLILDFFAGSGTTAHAVLELNREDGGNRKFILVTNNEKTPLNPNGIAIDVTTKRLKRIMSGECYNRDTNFKWLEKNKPYGDSLEVSWIKEISPFDREIFTKIDERLYGLEKFSNACEKIQWVCENFDFTRKSLEMQGLSEEKYEAQISKLKGAK
ncbi:site-specific DNA-methyltransferase [Helicobacter himalayensis]|uniref:site-specific DNA-methyltransferase n=1 Tax=Helicobacter himalayensis TaxID=1591088 RepID=UPI003D6DDFFE